MKKIYLFNLFFLTALTVFSFSAVKAQDDETPQTGETRNGRNIGNRRADLLDELNLSAEQRQQFRRINAEKRPAMRAAQARLKQANGALDQAVYADSPDENDVQARLREVQAAQAEVIKIRSLTELAVRRILTGEQLVKFREARRRFEADHAEKRATRRENRENRRLNAPNRRLGNRRQRTPASNEN